MKTRITMLLALVLLLAGSCYALTASAQDKTPLRSMHLTELTKNIQDIDKLDGIVIDEAPDASKGKLMFGTRVLMRGEGVAAEGIDALIYVPITSDPVTIIYTPVYRDGKTGVQQSYTIAPKAKTNTAPIASDVELTTYKNITVGGRFAAVDTDGDSLTYVLQTLPEKGSLVFSESDASFVYEPYQSKGGSDEFMYTAVDSEGAVSNIATVTIEIEKQPSETVYDDLEGSGAHYAALRLAEEGIMSGRTVGGRMYLEPTELMTRGEFISIAVALTGEETLPGCVETSFADDGDIPVWAKPFAVAAIQSGLIEGSSMIAEDGSEVRVMRPNDYITRAEAAVILNNSLGIEDVAVSREYTDEADIPTWARHAAVNLDTLGIIDTLSDGSLALGCAMTRADAVEMVYNTLEYLNEHSEKTGMLSWLTH